MTRSVYRFLYYRWTLLEVPNRFPTNLGAAWLERRGFPPPFHAGAVAGWQFRVGDGARAYVISQPNRLAVEDSVRSQLAATLSAKYGVAVRIARGDEVPKLRLPTAPPRAGDHAAVEEWPVVHHRAPVVLEYTDIPGTFVPKSTRLRPRGSLREAVVFDEPAEADAFLARLPVKIACMPRYFAAALAEVEQREAAASEGGWK